MKKLIAGLLCLTMILCAGCSYTQTGTESLVKPPKLSTEQDGLYKALQSSVGSELTLRYPRKGDYTSSFIVKNMDDDQDDEAIVFYSVASSGTQSLYLTALDTIEGRWRATYDVFISAAGIDKVFFVEYDHKNYIAAAFTNGENADKTLVIYSYDNGILNEKYRETCLDYEVFDINGDGSDELITFTENRKSVVPASIEANMLKILKSGVIKEAQAAMYPYVSSYQDIKKGKLPDGSPALYVDGYGDGYYTTEILSCGEKGFQNLIYSKSQDDLLLFTMRKQYIASSDFTGNGIIEIPITTVVNGYEKKSAEEQEFFTQWCLYDKDEGFKINRFTYTSTTLGYMFTIPSELVGSITVDSLSGENEVYFCEYNPDRPLEENLQNRLFSIKTLKRVDYDSQKSKSKYALLNDNGQLIYVYTVINGGTKFQVDSQLIRENFKLL